MRSLPRHVDHIVSDSRIINNGIIGFTETQIKPSDYTSKLIQTLKFSILILITMKLIF